MNNLDLLDSQKVKNIHFIGIGGSSMSGLAEILLNMGYKISGSDQNMTLKTHRLKEKGIQIYEGHSENNIKNPDLVVYTAAIKKDNPELVKARSMGIPTIERATLLGLIMKKYPFSIGVSGTHGKTSTTSMIASIMLKAGFDPGVHIGGELELIGGGTRIGKGDYFVTEACEYVDSFLKLHPYLAVILNIEADHLDYFKDINQIKDSFHKYALLVPKEGYVIGCSDSKNVLDVLEGLQCNVITYGLNKDNAQWSAKDINFDSHGCASYILTNNGDELAAVKLNVPGLHNVSNSIAAAAACYTLGCGLDAIKDGLCEFKGAKKRFELKGIVGGVTVIDDYAHHPSEIKATLLAAKKIASGRIWCVFQPHTYTRSKALLDDFAVAFKDADTVIVTDIYAAREKDTGEIHSSTIAQKINNNSTNAVYIPDFKDIALYLLDNASEGDIIITMGAGDVVKAGELFIEYANKHENAATKGFGLPLKSNPKATHF